ncbi:type VI secretion system protein TssA [Photorhabdus heterorhabditis]|uniref:type VI secretion system protein TssA n=1 Tax=Photorhabdus heterorhabditis TaxID=880156 RepID=UPI00156235EB|nr:type VI secretion system protein TssA [Photorhabdus heterorhabditis]NRN28985.1 type VI secretion system protein TssA [Photorhabdus heterorhabditis subsp. aluminescens]
MNIASLLNPISQEHPCGEDLEYSAEFMQLIQLAEGKAEQQFGDFIMPAQEPDWRQIKKSALVLLARSKDLRIIILLMQAWCNQYGLAGYEQGLLLLEQTISRYWETLWPAAELDGEPDLLMRINALQGLSDGFALAKQVRLCEFVQLSGITLTVADVMKCLDGSHAEDNPFPGGIDLLIAELRKSAAPVVKLIPQITATLQCLFSTLRGHLGDSGLPDMRRQMATLNHLTQLLAPETNTVETVDNTAYPLPEDTHPQQKISHGWQTSGIQNREQAQQALEAVRQYFLLHESSHPAPLMIERIQRLMSQDFMSIMRNLAPEAVDQLEHFFGREKHT